MKLLFIMLMAVLAFTSTAEAKGRYNVTHHKLVTGQHHKLVKAQHVGYASYYGSGRWTANGERYNPHGLTAASRTLPFGTRVRVKCVRTGRSVVVRINDRGPFVRGRIIDLSVGAAAQIGMLVSGVAEVIISVL